MEETKAIGAADFKQWILNQTSSAYTVSAKDERHFLLENRHGLAEINFYPQDIVEISVTSYKDNENKFWLHFQLNDEEHAKALFMEMKEAFLSLQKDHQLRVLLSCSCAMTTSYFAQKLNEAAKNLELEYSFEAVSCNRVYEVAQQYDIILLAPQIGYMLKKMRQALPDKPIAQWPVALYASYDALEAIEFVRQQMQRFEALKAGREELKQEPPHLEKSEKWILAIAFKIEQENLTRIYYRLFHKGKVLVDDMVIKPMLNFDDIADIVDTVRARYPLIDMIGIASPGIIQGGQAISYQTLGQWVVRGKDVDAFSLYDLSAWLQKKYGIPTLIANNANAAALGFYRHHPQYKTLVYHSQLYGMPGGGQGYVIDGMLHPGRKGISGEFNFSMPHVRFEHSLEEMARTDEGMLQLIAKAILNAIVVLGPDAVAVRSRMTPDMEELKKLLACWIPEEYLPEFFYVPEDKDYLLDGQMALCLKELERIQDA